MRAPGPWSLATYPHAQAGRGCVTISISGTIKGNVVYLAEALVGVRRSRFAREANGRSRTGWPGYFGAIYALHGRPCGLLMMNGRTAGGRSPPVCIMSEDIMRRRAGLLHRLWLGTDDSIVRLNLDRALSLS